MQTGSVKEARHHSTVILLTSFHAQSGLTSSSWRYSYHAFHFAERQNMQRFIQNIMEFASGDFFSPSITITIPCYLRSRTSLVFPNSAVHSWLLRKSRPRMTSISLVSTSTTNTGIRNKFSHNSMSTSAALCTNDGIRATPTSFLPSVFCSRVYNQALSHSSLDIIVAAAPVVQEFLLHLHALKRTISFAVDSDGCNRHLPVSVSSKDTFGRPFMFSDSHFNSVPLG